MSLPNKLIGCGEEIRGLAAPLIEGMKGRKNKQRGEAWTWSSNTSLATKDVWRVVTAVAAAAVGFIGRQGFTEMHFLAMPAMCLVFFWSFGVGNLWLWPMRSKPLAMCRSSLGNQQICVAIWLIICNQMYYTIATYVMSSNRTLCHATNHFFDAI